MDETSKEKTSLRGLDHIVYLLPYHQLVELPAWLTTNFTITPGGRHADGKTENKLIIFRDGSYIELIAFVNDDPVNMAGHWWGNKKPGIIDYAFTTPGDADEHWKAVQLRFSKLPPSLSSKYGYAVPIAGGRHRDDGVEVKWKVTFPEGVKRGVLPFFCHDVTPRQLRVPVSEESSSHPCGAYGLRGLTAVVPVPSEVSLLYAAVLGEPTPERQREHLISFNPPRDLEQKTITEQEGIEFESLTLGVVTDSGLSKPVPLRVNPKGEHLQVWLA